MPLLTSPIDGSAMTEIERYGIKLDLCKTSGGVWFDKGEVEKLIHFVREEALKEQVNIMPETKSGGRAPSEQIYKKKRDNPLSDILDIFDF